MFRFRVRTLLICVTVSAIGLSFLVAWWKEGERHEQLQKTLMQRHNGVEMSHQKNVVMQNSVKSGFRIPRVERVSTLPWLVESLGLSKIFRRIETITLDTYGGDNDKIERLLSEVRNVGALDHLFITHGNIEGQQISDLLSDISVRWLTLKTETLRATNGRWTPQKDLKQVQLLWGESFDQSVLAMLPPSIERLQFDCYPDDSVTPADFDRFPLLQQVEFKTPSQPELAEALKASQVSQAYEVLYFGKRL